jgi:hypothetical protein
MKERIKNRYEELLNSFSGEEKEIIDKQKHLDEGTPERIYWHYGYAGAKARSANLTQKQRSAIAKKAAKARWGKK